MAERRRKSVVREVLGKPEVAQSIVDAGIILVGARYAPKLASRGFRRNATRTLGRVLFPRRAAAAAKAARARRVDQQFARAAAFYGRREMRKSLGSVSPATDRFVLATDAHHGRWKNPEKYGPLGPSWWEHHPSRGGGGMDKGEFFRRLSQVQPKADISRGKRRRKKVIVFGS